MIRTYGAGPRAALALHCSLAHAGAWSALGAALGDLLTLTAPDLPGHGDAPWNTDDDIGDAAEAVAHAAMPAGRFDLIGHSFGAVVALRLALESPGRVRSLTLIEPSFFAAALAAGAPEIAGHLAAMRPVDAALATGDRETAARIFTEAWGTGVPWALTPEPQRRYMTDRIHLIPAAGPALTDDAAALLAPGRPESLRMPVLIVSGEGSPPVAHAVARALADRLPSARQASVPGAGHMVPVTHAGATARLLREFLG